jgi:hypothetical protein
MVVSQKTSKLFIAKDASQVSHRMVLHSEIPHVQTRGVMAQIEVKRKASIFGISVTTQKRMLRVKTTWLKSHSTKAVCLGMLFGQKITIEV